MRFVSSWIQSAVMALIVGIVAPCGYGAVIVNLYQDGSDVKLSLSGSISTLTNSGGGGSGAGNYLNLSSFDAFGSGTNELSVFKTAGSNQQYKTYDVYSQSSNQAWGGSGFLNSNSDSFTLTGVKYLVLGSQSFALDDNYVFGSQISATGTWNNTTLAALGVQNLGTYVYTAGNATNNDTVTFNIGSNPGGGGDVPEPTSMAIFGLGALGLAYRAKRKSKA